MIDNVVQGEGLVTLLCLGDSDWPGHKDGGRMTAEDDMVRVARIFDHLEWHAHVGDIEYDYSYNDYALVRLTALSYVMGGVVVHRLETVRWAVLNTQGCSCDFRINSWTTCVLGTAEEVCDWLIGMAHSVRNKEYLGTNPSAPDRTFLSWIDLVRRIQ